MSIVMYSGGDAIENRFIDREMFKRLKNNNPLFTMIPSSVDEAEFYYHDFIEQYSHFGVNKFDLFPIDTPFDWEEAFRLFQSDVIYLSGGNTFYFLMHLKKSGVMSLLRQFLDSGGILCGQSAGSIIFTPHIETASFPDFDRDDNDVGLQNLKAMNLVPFEFFPHFLNTRRYIHELNLKSRTKNGPIYAAKDGAGIIIDSYKTSFLGPIWGFLRGKKFKLT